MEGISGISLKRDYLAISDDAIRQLRQEKAPTTLRQIPAALQPESMGHEMNPTEVVKNHLCHTPSKES